MKKKKSKASAIKKVPVFRLTPERAAEMLRRRDRFQARAKAIREAGLWR